MDILDVILCKEIRYASENEASFIEAYIREIEIELGSSLNLHLAIIGAPLAERERVEVLLEFRQEDRWEEIKGVGRGVGPESESWLAPMDCGEHFKIEKAGDYRFAVRFTDDEGRPSQMFVPFTASEWERVRYHTRPRLLVD